MRLAGKKVSFVCVGKKGSQLLKKLARLGRVTVISWVIFRCLMPEKLPRILLINF